MVVIKEIFYYHISMPLKMTFQTSFGETNTHDTIIIKVVSSDLAGYSEIPVNTGPWYSYETITTALHVSLDFIAPRILGADIQDIGEIKDLIKNIRGHEMAKAGHEMAVLDLIAKYENKPLAKLIGGVKSKIEAGVSIGVISDLEKLHREVSRFLDEGYRRIKIKIKPGWDLDPIDMIRREFGKIKLQVDANAAYDLDKHLDVFIDMDRYDLLMLEQPLHYNDLYRHSILRSKISTPICLDESIRDIYDTEAAIALGSCDVINVKPPRVGGLLETIKINNYAEKHDIPIWIGGLLESGIGRGHLVAAATLSNVKYPCDISASNRYYDMDIVEPEWVVEKGYIDVPREAGIGVEVREDRILKYLVREIHKRL